LFPRFLPVRGREFGNVRRLREVTRRQHQRTYARRAANPRRIDPRRSPAPADDLAPAAAEHDVQGLPPA
jgi:hypothetical protein